MIIENDKIIEIYRVVLKSQMYNIRIKYDLKILEAGFLAGIRCMDIEKDDLMKITNQLIDIRKRMFGDRDDY